LTFVSRRSILGARGGRYAVGAVSTRRGVATAWTRSPLISILLGKGHRMNLGKMAVLVTAVAATVAAASAAGVSLVRSETARAAP